MQQTYFTLCVPARCSLQYAYQRVEGLTFLDLATLDRIAARARRAFGCDAWDE